MKSVVELVVHAPQSEVVACFCDPREQPKWMRDVARVEPVRGQLGAPGSVYRIVPADGKEPFVANVIARRSTRLDLRLERSDVTVEIAGKFVRLDEDETQLISVETFTFRGIFGKLIGIFARRAIQRAHRRQLEAFKRFVEQRPRPYIAVATHS